MVRRSLPLPEMNRTGRPALLRSGQIDSVATCAYFTPHPRISARSVVSARCVAGSAEMRAQTSQRAETSGAAEQLAEAEREVDALPGVEARIADRLVTVVELRVEDLLGAPEALGAVAAGQLDVHAAGDRPLGAMGGEEAGDLAEHDLELAR